MEKYYAVIDIGSNTMRLVVYSQVNTGRLHEVENVKAVARLRNYLDAKSNLTDEGIVQMLGVLDSFKEVLNIYSLEELACVATATIRQANNNTFIQKKVKQQIGWEMRILSEKEEAYYGYLSVVNSTSIEEGITVDIGGGSTEVTYFKDRVIQESHSFPFGALTLKQFFSDNKPETALGKLQTFLLEQFSILDWLKEREVPLIGIGGSARNMAQIDQSLKDYPLAGLHQYKMNDSDIAKILHYLSPLCEEELQKVDGLSTDRADTIVPAVAVFHALYQTTQADCFVLSRKGLRDGVFYEKSTQNLKDHLYPNVLQDSIRELIHEYSLDQTQIEFIQFLTKKLFNGLKERRLGSHTQRDWELLERACSVYNLGNYIDSESSAQHTFYLLANRTIDGLMHIDRLRLALIASFKSKNTFKQFVGPFEEWFLKEEKEKLSVLGALLKFSYCLDATKRQVVKDLDIEMNDRELTITLYCDKDFHPEQYQTNKQKKHLEKALHKDINLQFILG
ncbi:Ppx/GppA family phosphatase [Oceanobacillus bengalensis]|uniref:Ppx/GppA family phosphatase n=1 Tax=Oceanobacillus bengalensis TaxID=1435466 RepID=A0A494Z2A4_9BACI|nr:Ppx/GppA family phosphatase [Oceanobacillus bengalensis]RKQ16615.1 Ppx/GppA family phosphatase [Oceanobacillus bengalensis]